MSDAARQGVRPGIMIASEDQALANLIQTSLERQLPIYSVESCATLEQVNRRLSETREFRWLITTARIPCETLVVNDQNGCDLARQWVLGEGHFAIVITDDWESINWLRKRLSAIPSEYPASAFGQEIVNIIHAGDAGTNYVPPTVVRIEFVRTGPKNENCELRFGHAEGPFSGSLENLRRNQAKKPVKLGRFADLTLELRPIFEAKTTEERNKAIVQGSESLWKKTGWLRILTGLCETLRNELFHDAVLPEPFDAPCPVHLQIAADPELMAIPLDMACEKDRYLCCRLPVTWRIRSGVKPPNERSERNRNRTTHDRFRAISAGLNEQDAKNHIKTISEHLGGTVDHRHAESGKAFCEALIADQPGASAYVISHGLKKKGGDRWGIPVGANGTFDARESLVTAAHIQPKDGRLPWNFIFFNCCSLADYLLDPEEPSHFGGFTEEILSKAVCREVVANRWKVLPGQAMALAEDFYRSRPTTAQGRADALYKARSRVRRSSENPEDVERPTGLEEGDTTWLAPIHIWAE
jgi:hypothetical protein